MMKCLQTLQSAINSQNFVSLKRSFSMIRENVNKNSSMISPRMRSYFVKYCDFDVVILLSYTKTALFCGIWLILT